jgi:hypothetical protein
METVMVNKFRALLVTKDGKRLSVADLMDGDIPVRVEMMCCRTSYDGEVAACGLARGVRLAGDGHAPFILRDVTLTDVNSVFTSGERREEASERLATDFDLAKRDA